MSEEGEDEISEPVEVPVKSKKPISKSPAKMTGKRKRPEPVQESA